MADPLLSVPGLGGYLAQRQRNEQLPMQDLGQASQAMGLLGALQQQQQEAQLRGMLAQTGGDVEKALAAALQSGNVAAAGKLAPLVKVAQERRQMEALSGLDMNDPQALRRAGALLGKPEFLTRAEQLEKLARDKATVTSFQRRFQPTEEDAAGNVGTQTVPGTGLFSELMGSPHVGNEARYWQGLVDSGNIPAADAQKRYESLLAKHTTEVGRQTARDESFQNRQTLIDAAAANRPPTPPSLVYRRNPDGTVDAIDFRTERVMKNVVPPGALNADVRSETSQNQFFNKAYDAATKPVRDAWREVGSYRAIRETGDTAQAATLAADLLRRAARSGNREFKGEADKLLGNSFRGGSVDERIANFLSTLATGTPTAQTMQRLDGLMDALEGSNAADMARRAQYYANQIRGRMQGKDERSITRAIVSGLGTPFVEGNWVVTPTGDARKFASPEAAADAARKWMQENGGPQ